MYPLFTAFINWNKENVDWTEANQIQKLQLYLTRASTSTNTTAKNKSKDIFFIIILPLPLYNLHIR